jgi:hypothetical protein
MVDSETASRSERVTRTSHALDLEPGVFTWDDPNRITRSVKRSAEASSRRKGSSFRSAMSMSSCSVNRAGRRLPASQRETREQAKRELRVLSGRPPGRGH